MDDEMMKRKKADSELSKYMKKNMFLLLKAQNYIVWVHPIFKCRTTLRRNIGSMQNSWIARDCLATKIDRSFLFCYTKEVGIQILVLRLTFGLSHCGVCRNL